MHDAGCPRCNENCDMHFSLYGDDVGGQNASKILIEICNYYGHAMDETLSEIIDHKLSNQMIKVMVLYTILS